MQVLQRGMAHSLQEHQRERTTGKIAATSRGELIRMHEAACMPDATLSAACAVKAMAFAEAHATEAAAWSGRQVGGQ
jgi:hypothetical protein